MIQPFHSVVARMRMAGGDLQPDEISGLEAWWKMPIAGEFDGSNIALWDDSAGSFDLSSGGGGSDPVYNEAVVNGIDAADFPTGSRSLACSLSASTYPRTYFAVLRADIITAGESLTVFGADTDGGLQLIVTENGNLFWIRQFVEAIGSQSTSALTQGQWYVIVAIVTSSTYEFYINAVGAGSGSHSVSLTSSRTVVMGWSGSTSTDGWDGHIAEAGAYSTAISSGDAIALSNGLIAKFGL